MTEPQTVLLGPGDDHSKDLLAGRAIGLIEDGVEWSVQEITPVGAPEVILTFVSEEAARAHWHETGGQLVRTARMSWTLMPGWRELAGGGDS